MREIQNKFFIFISEPPPTFTAIAVEVVQVEDNAKEKRMFFTGIVETQPTLSKGRLKGERNTK